MTDETIDKLLQEERARFYAAGRFDGSSLEFVRQEDFVSAVVAEGAPFGRFPGLYNRMLAEKRVALAQARAAETRAAA